VAGLLGGVAGLVGDRAALRFGELLRQLRVEARLTQDELAQAAKLSPRAVSDLERGIHRTARKDTAELLAGALDLAGPVRELFVAAARDRGPAEDVLAARDGMVPVAGHMAALQVRRCPYRGLLPFAESDAEVFYGRERLAAELAAKVAARAASGGLVVVTGASGSGKSSLLRAGLLPILARGQQLPGSERWPRIVMTPTKEPLTELAARLAALGGPDALAVRDGLARQPDQAHLAVRSTVLAAAARREEELPGSGDGTARLVLIVDQFEQVFTLNPDAGGEAARQAFITALCAAAAGPAGPGREAAALVAVAVRGDFWDRCAAVPELVSALQDGHFVVGPMTESELRVAITGPAGAAGLRIDTALTETILGDLRVAGGDRSAGVLPLLSQAMALTWEQREGDRLTSHGYAQAGGVSHAVQTGADRVYDALPAGLQAIAREVLRAMTVAGRDGTLARRPVTREDLYAGLPETARSDIDEVLDAFAAERLAVLDGDTVQLSHDVLLRAWPRLRGWLEDDQAGWIVHGQLADAAAAWRDSREDPSFLYRGAQLAALQQAVTRWSANPARSPVLTGPQRAFLRASERAAARSSRWRRGAFAVLALLTALALAASGLASSQRAAAVRQRNQAIYNQLIAEALQFGASNTTFAAQLTLAAYRIRPTQDLASRLLNTENTPLSSPLNAGSGGVNSVAFSSTGHTLASGNSGGIVRLWDMADPAHPRRLGSILTGAAAVNWVAFSPGGRTLASGDAKGVVRLWDLTDPARPRPLGQPLTGGTGAVETVAFSPGGRTLASSDDDGTIRLWDVTDPARPRTLGQPLTGGTGAVYSVAFSPGGRTLASSGVDGAIRLWDITELARPRPLGQPLTGAAAVVVSLAFSPGGRTLAGGDTDGTVRLWDLTDPAHPRPLGQPLTSSTASVVSLAFSPGGRTLASGGVDGTVRLWDLTDPARPRPLGQPLTGAAAAVVSVAFSPGGRTLASGSLDGTIRLWNLPQTVLTGAVAAAVSVAFSPGGRTLAGGGADGAVRLWDVTDPARPRPLGRPLTGAAAAVVSVAFSPAGRTLASSSLDGTIRLWDLTDPAHPGPLGSIPPGRVGVPSVAFSPDGRTLASSDYTGAVRLWDLTDPTHPRPIGQPLTGSTAAVVSVAFSPDGRTLAGAGVDGVVRLWDLTDPARPRPLGSIPPGRVGVVSVAFSPGGRTLAGGGVDGAVRLWDLTDPAHPRPLGQPLTGSTAAVYSVAFSPGGRTLASSGADGAVRLWDLTDPTHPRPLGQPLTGSTAAVASVAFGPDERTLASGSFDGAIRLWNLNVQYAIQRICATAGGLTPQQWNQYIPQLRYQPSCAH
jgi:WD40 repeat protein/transcriptional regulator with XRE-family HTH domain